MKKIYSLVLLVPIMTLMSCAKGQLESQSNLSSLTGGNTGSSITPPTTATPDISSLDLKGQVVDGSNVLGSNGSLALDFDKTKGEFIIMVPMPSGMIFGATGSFSQHSDIRFSPVYDATGKMKMAVRVPVHYVIKGLNTVQPTTLPSGEALPAMPAGLNELPSLGLSFPLQNNVKLHLYVGVNALGLFMTIPQDTHFQLPINITVPVKTKDKSKTLGYVTYVSPKNNFEGGLFVSTTIPATVARVLEDYFKL